MSDARNKNIELIRGILDINTQNVDIYSEVKLAIAEQLTTVDEIMRLMMSPEDIEDLKQGRISFESLKCHVKVWCEMGKPDQNYIPATKEEVKEAADKVMEKFKPALDNLSKR